MRVLYFGNNWVGWKIASALREAGAEIAGVVLHPAARCGYGAEIVEALGITGADILEGPQLKTPDALEWIRTRQPDVGVSALFGYLVPRAALDLMPQGCFNIHPALLPFNRGAFPNGWSIVEGTPAGATIHYMDDGIDTGDIVAQREVAVTPIDTGESLYKKLEDACVDLFRETWPSIEAGQITRRAQGAREGTSHRVRDVAAIDEIVLDRSYRARDLIDVIRARTFSRYKGAYVVHGGRRVYIRLEFQYDDEQETSQS